jgi:hypothetical protein
MSYITNGGGSGTGTASKPKTFTPTGAINGINTTFVLPSAADPASLLLRLNGVIQETPSDYTLAGDNVTITMVKAPQPADAVTGTPADKLVAYY